MGKKRVVFFFDGFNFYHSLKDNRKYWDFLWLDYRKLAELFTPKTCILQDVVCFTAYTSWKLNSKRRHQDYIRALRTKGVSIIFGRFKTRDRFCKVCYQQYLGHEEKQTDVNIAVNILLWAFHDRFDEIVLSTADSDIIPAVKALKQEFPHKILTLLLPIGRRSYELQGLADKVMYVKEKHLRGSQFPDDVKLPDGSTINRPDKWRSS